MINIKFKRMMFFIALFFLLFLSSCYKVSQEEISFEGIEYNIKYYLNNKEVEINPNKYISGNEVVLPKLDVEGFEGWYFNSNFSGNEIKYLSIRSYGNKILYAKIIDKNTNDLINNELFTSWTRLNDIIKTVNNNEGVTRGFNSIGTVKALVIPVDFSDYKADNDMKEVLETALFGSGYETGWESLKSYYQKSSYGKLTIDGFVTDVYHTNKRASYFAYQDNGEGINEIIKGALEYFDSSINYDEYDSDGDTYIDAIYIVYSHHVEYDSDSIWWAFTDQYFTKDYEYYDNVEANFYCFIGYDFLFEEPRSGVKIKYNCETFIHETGHLLGLDDYYDYDDSDYYNMGGLGGCDMMDNNVGDHNPYSKTILNWITPEVIDEASDINKTIKLRKFQDSGDAIILCKQCNNTFYDEYYILSFYTPDGLNKLEVGYGGLFSIPGVVLYHVSAAIKDSEVASVWDMTKNNNASSKVKLIELIEADGKDNISRGGNSTNSDLFLQTMTINNLSWNDGDNVKFNIYINEINNDYAVINIYYNK